MTPLLLALHCACLLVEIDPAAAPAPRAGRARPVAQDSPPARLAAVRAALGEVAEARDAGRHDEALAALARAREACAGLEESDEAELLEVVRELERAAATLGRLDIQLEARQRLLRSRARASAPPDAELLTAELRVVETLLGLGDVRGADRALERLRATWGEHLPPEDDAVLMIEINLVHTRGALGDAQAALDLAEHVHAEWGRRLPVDDPNLLATKLTLASARKACGDIDGALELEEAVVATWTRQLPEEDPNLLTAKMNYAATLKHVGDLAGARAIEEEVLRVRRRTLPADHPALLMIEGNLARTVGALGDLQGAIELHERALAGWQRSVPADHPDLLLELGNLAATQREAGDFLTARELGERLVAAYERLVPPHHPALLRARGNLALVRKEIGDLDGSRGLEEQVLAGWEATLPENHLDLLRGRQNLAGTLLAMGETERAAALLRTLHETRTQLLHPDDPDLMRTKLNLAEALGSLGDRAAELALEQEVLEVWTRLFPADHPHLLRARATVAETLAGLGEFEAALEEYRDLGGTYSRLYPRDHPHLLAARSSLAATALRAGLLPEARAATRNMLAGQQARAVALSAESPRVARSAALQELSRLFLALDVDRLTADASEVRLVEELFACLANLRRASTASVRFARIATESPALGELRNHVADARARLNALAVSPPDDAAGLETWRHEMISLAEVRDGMERDLRSALLEAGVPSEPITAATVARGLAPGAAAITYLRAAQTWVEVGPGGTTEPPSDTVIAFVLNAEGAVARVELGPCSELEDLALRWRSLLGKPVQRGLEVRAAAATDSEREVGRELRRRILDPCLAALDSELSTAHVVLDDFLHLVPLDALSWDDDRRVGDVLPLRFEVSLERLAAPASSPTSGGTLVTLGGASFGAAGVDAPARSAFLPDPPARDGRRSTSRGFAPLLQTRYEAETIGRLYEDFVGGEPVVLLGDAATKRAVVEFAPRAHYLHLATHGWFAPEELRSLRDDDPVAGIDIDRASESLRGFAPDTLCGLALAGANRGPDALGRLPGILTAEELATIDLGNCQLAVLSACETNVGLRRAGQGIQSLQSALHTAGARAAVTSLWEVDDAATRRLMELFYSRLWEDRGGKADALWRAKRDLRDAGHPLRDWAGWVLTGNPN